MIRPEPPWAEPLCEQRNAKSQRAEAQKEANSRGRVHTPEGVCRRHYGDGLLFLSFVWSKVANAAYGPITMVLFRLAMSVAVIWVWAKSTKSLSRPGKQDLKRLLHHPNDTPAADCLQWIEPDGYLYGTL